MIMNLAGKHDHHMAKDLALILIHHMEWTFALQRYQPFTPATLSAPSARPGHAVTAELRTPAA